MGLHRLHILQVSRLIYLRFPVQCCNHSFIDLVPSESPIVTVQSVSTTDVQLVISPPPSIGQNGPIIAYEIRIETFRFSIASELRNTTDIPAVYPLTLNVPFNASSLQEFVEYNISVRAYTSAGVSEFSSIVQPITVAAGLFVFLYHIQSHNAAYYLS